MQFGTALSLCFMLSLAFKASEALRDNVFGGTQAMEGQFPYMAALFRKHETLDYTFFCSGSIIGEKWILTAAHCTYMKGMQPGTLRAEDCDEIFVVVGEVFATSKSQMHTVRKCHRLPKYTNTFYFKRFFDLALLELDEKLTWTPSISQVRLGPLRVKNVFAAGYGSESEGEKEHPRFDNRTLKYIPLETVSFEECTEWYYRIKRTNHICARNTFYGGPCKGDSGGPLVGPNNLKQVGIVSFAFECAGKAPTVFLRVAHFLPWIERVTGLRF